MRAGRCATAALGAALALAPKPAPAQLERGDVLVTGLVSGRVFRLDPSGFDPSAPVTVAPIPVQTGGAFGSPRGLAVDRNGLLLVVDNGPKTLERVDPGSDSRALAAQFSTLSTALRGVAPASDGRVYVADPGIVPLQFPPLPAIRGVTFYPMIDEIDLVNGLPAGVQVAGCTSPSAVEDCGNFFLPTGVVVASEEPEIVLLVADGGRPPPPSPRLAQGVLRVFPERPRDPGVNDEKFCVPGPFTFPRSLAIDPRNGTVLVTDSGDPTATPAVPARVYRVAASGCDADGNPPPELVAEGPPLERPVGIAVDDTGRIFVADNLADTVFEIPDAIPGQAETAVEFATHRSVDGAWDLQIYRAAPSPYFVADASVPAAFAIQPAVPARSLVTSAGDLVAPASLEVLPMGAGLVLADPEARAIVETTLGEPGVQTCRSRGGRLAAPTTASREAGGTYLVTDLGDAAAVPPLAPAVIRVDPSQPPSPCPSSNQSVISEGGKLVKPVAGAIDADGYLIVVDGGAGTAEAPPRILRISPDDDAGSAGQVTLYSGPPLAAPTAIAIEDDAILVADAGAGASDPPSVRRYVRSILPPGAVGLVAGIASGGLLDQPAGLALDTDGSILVADRAGDVVRVDALSGLQSAVPTAGPLGEPTGIGITAPTAGVFVDQDADGAADGADNCIALANPDQRDTNSDGFGNACDPDFDDNGVVGASDLAIVARRFGATDDDPPPSRYDPDVDIDGDGLIGTPELARVGQCFAKLPGQSGIFPAPAPPPARPPCFPGTP